MAHGQRWIPAISILCSLVISGCGGSGSLDHHPAIPESAAFAGKAVGGQFPVSGASIQLYAAGSAGYGAGAQALLSPALTTDANGEFSVTPSEYTCPSANSLTYLVATGGDPGLGSDNPYITLMAPLGPCGQLTSLTFVVVNEATTVASAWALSRFLGPGAEIGTSSTNSQGLANAFTNVKSLINITTGTTSNTSAPAGTAIPSTKIYTLANILASCVNSSGSTACNALFSAATPPAGTAPANTLDAALDIARNPGNKVSALFALSPPQAPFGPALSTAPNDWTLALGFGGGGLNVPTSLAIDVHGNVWASNYCGSNSPCSSVTELGSNGEPLSPSTGYTDGTMFESYGMAIAPNGNLWVTNYNSVSSTNGGHGSVGELSSSGQILSASGGISAGGIYGPVAIATDTDGSIWTANQGASTVSKLSSSGSAISGSGGWGSGHLAGPAAVAIDASHNAWFANQLASSGTVTVVSADGSSVNEIDSGGDQPSGLATDAVGTAKGHLWIANYSTSTVSELQLNTDGTITTVSTGYSGGGLNHPNGIAVDGSGDVWVTNYRGNSLSELEGAGSTTPGQALSSSSGFGTDASLAEPYAAAVDASGNLWVSNSGSNTITQFLGVAVPVKTPLVGPAQLP